MSQRADSDRRELRITVPLRPRPRQALAIVELLEDLVEAIWQAYGDELANEVAFPYGHEADDDDRGHSIDDRDLPF